MRKYREEDYSVLFGVKKTFDEMLLAVENQYEKDHLLGGRRDGATPKEWLEITLKYLRQYLSQRYLAADYGISKSCVSTIIEWTTKVLVVNKAFRLPNRTQNVVDESESRVVDATESKIDRPIKKQSEWYSGKKKMHTFKTQIEIGLDSLLIYSVDFAKGSVHDFKLFKNSKVDYGVDTPILVDMGYMGILKIHKCSLIPIRSSKLHKLDNNEKWYNSEISKLRIVVEHVNAYLKKFKIVSTRYRNRRKKFNLFMTLLCGIYNFETADR